MKDEFNVKLIAFIKEKFGEQSIISQPENTLQFTLIVQSNLIAQIGLELKNNPAFEFDYLSCLSAVDYGSEMKLIGVVYHIYSLIHQKMLVLKIQNEWDEENSLLPSFPSVSSVWKTALWHEREAYDLMGINFEGHPDLRRILLPEDWEGYPLRKNYQQAEKFRGIDIAYKK